MTLDLRAARVESFVMRTTARLFVTALFLVSACDEPKEEAAETVADDNHSATEPAAAAPAEPEPDTPPLLEPKDPNEACAQIVSVAFTGAEEAPEGLSRDEAAAAKRAKELLAEVREGADFREMAAEHSDAASKVRRGAIGTFTRDKWPEKHGALADTLFALKVHEVSDVVKAPYGYTFIRRCPVEKVHTRHVLIRYAGAKNAPEDLKRSRDQAQSLAMEVYGKAKNGAAFEELAKEFSEDGSAERGGDLGSVGRGLFVPPYEEAAFALKPQGISAPVESVYGFHVIQRLE